MQLKRDKPVQWTLSYEVDGRTYVSDGKLLLDQRYVLVRPLPERGKMSIDIIRGFFSCPEQVRFSVNDLKVSFFGNWETPERMLVHRRYVSFLRNLPLGETLHFGIIAGKPAGIRIYDGDFLIGLMGPAEIKMDLWEAAESGDAQAEFEVGVYLWAGMPFEQDHAEAVKWLQRAVDQGHASAARALGICTFFGTGCPRDAIGGLALLERAIAKGCPEAVTTRENLIQFMAACKKHGLGYE